MAMRLGYVKDDNGKLVRKWFREGDDDSDFLFPVVAEFGDYLWTDDDRMEEAKEHLLEHLFNAIRNLAKDDRFWLVKRLSDFEKDEAEYSSATISLFPVPQEAKAGKCTLGWRLHLPQMEGYYKRDEADEYQKRLDECLVNLNN